MCGVSSRINQDIDEKIMAHIPTPNWKGNKSEFDNLKNNIKIEQSFNPAHICNDIIAEHNSLIEKKKQVIKQSLSKGSITQEQASNQIFAFEFGPKSEFTFDKFYKEKREELETKLGREDEALDKLKKIQEIIDSKTEEKKTKKKQKKI